MKKPPIFRGLFRIKILLTLEHLVLEGNLIRPIGAVSGKEIETVGYDFGIDISIDKEITPV